MVLWMLIAAAEAGYVDPNTCQPCHARIFESFRKTGMGRSFAKAAAPPPLTELFHPLSKRSYSVVARSGSSYLRRVEPGAANVIEKRIDYLIASANHSRTFFSPPPQHNLLHL